MILERYGTAPDYTPPNKKKLKNLFQGDARGYESGLPLSNGRHSITFVLYKRDSVQFTYEDLSI